MIVEFVVVGLAGVGMYATLKGTFGAVAEAFAKSEEAKVKAEIATLKTSNSAEVSKVEATASADFAAFVAKVKSLL
jgi:hypothetical protein